MNYKAMNQWNLFREYINSSKIGDLITRKDINKAIYKDPLCEVFIESIIILIQM